MTHSAWNTTAATDRSLADKEQKSDPTEFVNGTRMNKKKKKKQGKFNGAPVSFKDLEVLKIHQEFGLAYL